MQKSSFLDGNHNLRSGITILPSQDKAIDNVLGDLAQQLPARFLLLTDVTGQVVSARGERTNKNLVALSSLVAGDLAASQEIARMTGEYQDCQLIVREGKKHHTFITEAGCHLVLFVQISNDVPLGWARMLIQDAASNIVDIIVMAPPDFAQMEYKIENDDFSEEFSQALDDLWAG